MTNRREFIKNGLVLTLGAGGVLMEGRSIAFPGAAGKKWAMIIDMTRCTGCQSCMVGCKLQNNTAPDQFNTRISGHETGTYPNAGLGFTADICRHCNPAPCLDACERNAVFVHDSGLVMTDWNLCDAGGDCMDACPYDARFRDVRFKDRSDKCDLCLNRITQGMVPACVENCAANARVFGRLDNPTGEFKTYLDAISARNLNEQSVHIIGTDGKET